MALISSWLNPAHIHYSLTFLLQTKEKDLTVQIDKLGEVGASTGDQEGHLVTVQELIQVLYVLYCKRSSTI